MVGTAKQKLWMPASRTTRRATKTWRTVISSRSGWVIQTCSCKASRANGSLEQSIRMPNRYNDLSFRTTHPQVCMQIQSLSATRRMQACKPRESSRQAVGHTLSHPLEGEKNPCNLIVSSRRRRPRRERRRPTTSRSSLLISTCLAERKTEPMDWPRTTASTWKPN